MYTWQQLVELYQLSTPHSSNLEPRYNICPTDTIDVVVHGGDQRALVPMRWGLIPGWWRKPLKEMRLAIFNARSDSVADQPMFSESFAKRRCLIPASGYYEWVTTPEGKQSYYFTRRNGQIITIAGIQDGRTDPANGERLRSCAMVITDANQFVADIHDRMPVILEPKDFEQWERGNLEDAAALMKSANDAFLDKRPVSRRVNSSRAVTGGVNPRIDGGILEAEDRPTVGPDRIT
jgi:putative SOS response-associated peptidase YedK